MAKINKISIQGFKSIKNLTNFELSSGLNIFIGANGAGKTNLISYFKFLNSIINERMQITIKKNGGASKILYNGLKVTASFHSEVYFDNNGYIFTLEPTQSSSLIFMDEIVYFSGHYGPSNAYIGKSNDETKLLSHKGTGWKNTTVHDFVLIYTRKQPGFPHQFQG